jgi:hypothetical protein
MRQQTEARNPLAFAPKVVNNATNSPANMMVISFFKLLILFLCLNFLFEVKMIYRKKENG